MVGGGGYFVEMYLVGNERLNMTILPPFCGVSCTDATDALIKQIKLYCSLVDSRI